MKVIELVNRGQCESLIGRTPVDAEFDWVVNPPCSFELGGKCVGVYDTLPRWLSQRGHEIVRQVRPTTGKRTQGLPVRSTVLGSLPRVPIRNYFCRLSAESLKHPDLLKLAADFARQVCSLYKRHLPSEFDRHVQQTTSEIVPDWVISGTPFTTVNFNVNHAIKYHRDAANQKGVWSNVIILRKHSRGGLLVLPEYRVALTQSDGAIIIFNGQSVIHGVTPIETNQDGYRCSIVLYALDQFRNCYPQAAELEFARNRRTAVESEFRTEALAKRIAKGHNANESIAKKRRAKT